MTLAEYAESRGFTDAEMGALIGRHLSPPRVIPRVTIRQWRLRLRMPRDPRILAAITEATKKKVTVSDIFASAA